MMTFLIIIHVFVCIVLIALVLIQRGRGAGLVESFAGVESMFGTKTSVFLTRTTTIMSVIFFLTCLGLAVLSVKQSKSLMRNLSSSGSKVDAAQTETVKPQATESETAQAQTAKPEAVNANLPAESSPAETANLDAAKAQ
ncbi:MAG: preprotein translocase subunit SecG [Candidatus Omnitrophica bacterium CG11_big_fil_rev_8_21_14_0_20_43_6]|nr:MAG: preprotein translocase subunit SecG [Candidatus Omnitrophica bacterium CG11_big_fil_rev_8_21_14_0_20_43_6]